MRRAHRSSLFDLDFRLLELKFLSYGLKRLDFDLRFRSPFSTRWTRALEFVGGRGLEFVDVDSIASTL